MTLPSLQWTGEAEDLIGTATLTIEQVADAAESRILWTDQAVQRGIQPAAPKGTPTELPLSDGYPDESLYIFDGANADDMTEKLLRSDRLFLNPLVWNLRPGTFEAYWNEGKSDLYLYSGKVFLPDSHHRHQAIVKAVRAYREHPSSYPKFTLARQFKVEVYFLTREEEGNYFFDKNQRTKSTALSKAYDLTTQDDLSVLAKRVLAHAPDLDVGVNRATDRLSKKAPHFMTLSTLRGAVATFAGDNEVEDSELEGLALVAADFLRMMADARPELQVDTPHSVRSKTLASSGVMVHAYGYLMRDYNRDIGNIGRARAQERWNAAVSELAPDKAYHYDGWRGDFFDRRNPLWQRIDVVRIDDESDRPRVLNTGGSRSRAAKALRERLREIEPSIGQFDE